MSSYLEINLNSLEKTYKKIINLYQKEIIFVLKSNAYGLGIQTISHFAYFVLNIKRFACASAEEAYQILEVIPDFKGTIYLLSEFELIDHPHIVSVIFSFTQLQKLKNERFSLKLNIGLNRLGFSYEDLPLVVQHLKTKNRFDCLHLFSQFSAKTNIPQEEEIKELLSQKAIFHKSYDFLQAHNIRIQETSLCKSSASFSPSLYENTDFLRLGLSLYGIFFHDHLMIKVYGQIIKSFFCKKGSLIGYYQDPLQEDSFITVISLGYDDMDLSSFSNKHFNNFFFQGSISMNVSTLVSKESLGKEGDFICLWNNSQELLNFLTIGQKRAHNFLTSFNHRLARKYVYNKKKYSYASFFPNLG